MAFSGLRFIKRYAELVPRIQIKLIPAKTRGFYTLSCEDEVIYVGMAGGAKAGIRGRLMSHMRSKVKQDLWTHFSIYEVHDNITEDEIKELEGLFRHIYRKNADTNALNKQRCFKRLKPAKHNNLKRWNNVSK